MIIQKRWNNLVGRGLLLVLLALFAVPCIACEDAVGRWLSHHAHDAAQSIHAAAPVCGHEVCQTPHHQAPSCNCLSDASKVRKGASVTVPIVPAAVLPPVFLPLPEPVPIRVADAEPDHPVHPLLVHPAVADRAPPAS